MSNVVVLVEHSNGEVKKVSLELLALAGKAGTPIAVALGPGAGNTAADLGAHGAAKVYTNDDSVFVDYVVAPVVDALTHVVNEVSASLVLIASTANGKEVAGRLAIATNNGVITDAVDVAADGTVTQNVFGGATIVHSAATTATSIVTVRPNATEPVNTGGSAEAVAFSPAIADSSKLAKISSRQVVAKSGRPDLSEAAIVVSGGRGVGGEEAFGSVIEPLADALGAAVGASRAATDAGWYPHQFQVGQTGKTVAPSLYVANGISGAIQHRAGMQTSKAVIVVNKDAEAPIFDLADFGVVGDLHSVLPALTELVKARKS